MIHKACMPVYMNSGKIVADGWTGGREKSKVLQEVLADLKILVGDSQNTDIASQLKRRFCKRLRYWLEVSR